MAVVRAVCLAVALFAAAPTVAWAGEVHRDGTVLRWTGTAGETNDARLYGLDTGPIVIDSAGVTAGGGCTQTAPDTVTCAPDSLTAIALDAGDRDDAVLVTSSGWPVTIRGGPGADTLGGYFHSGLTLDGGPGADVLNGYTGNETLVGGEGDDRLNGDSSADRLEGGPGADQLAPGGGGQWDGGDVVRGGDGVDQLSFYGGFGDRRITFDDVAGDGTPGEGDDYGSDIEVYVGSNGVDEIVGSSVANDFTGSTGADVLDGGGGDDVLRASDGDTLRGGAGDDRIDESEPVMPGLPGFNGSSVIEGGPGTDLVDYGTRSAGLRVDNDGAADDGDPTAKTFGLSTEVERDNVMPDVERIVGGAARDVLLGGAVEGNGGDDLMLDRPGDQTFDGGPGDDEVSYAARTDPVRADADGVGGDDGGVGEHDTVAGSVERLTGGSGADILTGSAAANVLRGGGGGDTLSGGDGVDTVDYGDRTAGVIVSLGAGPDDGEPGERDDVAGDFERVLGGAGDDLLIGDASAERLDGANGDDILDGGGGPDVLRGDSGFDVVTYDLRGEPLIAAIDDTAGSGGAQDGPPGARDVIGHDVEALWGGSGADRLSGDASDNVLSGGDGADLLVGGAGDDTVDYSDRGTGVTVAPDGLPNSGNERDGAAGTRDTVSTDIEGIFGGSGADSLTGSAVPNLLDGGAGDDRLDTRDGGPDLALCGDGVDTLLFDDADEWEECEIDGTRAPPSPASATPPSPASVTPLRPLAADASPPRATVLLAARQKLATALARGLALQVACSEACRLAGELRVDARTARRAGLRNRVVATGRAARDGRVVLRFAAHARKHLRNLRRVSLTLTVTASDARGNRATVQRRITLTRRSATLG